MKKEHSKVDSCGQKVWQGKENPFSKPECSWPHHGMEVFIYWQSLSIVTDIKCAQGAPTWQRSFLLIRTSVGLTVRLGWGCAWGVLFMQWSGQSICSTLYSKSFLRQYTAWRDVMFLPRHSFPARIKSQIYLGFFICCTQLQFFD